MATRFIHAIHVQIVHVASGGTAGISTRSRCFINGAATSLRVLRDLGGILVDANTQNAALTLK